MNNKRVRLRSVGLVTRSTVGDEVPDPREESLSDILHWIWSWRVQVGRLRESTKQELRSGSDALEQRKFFSKTSLDEHILAVVGWNLARAIRRAATHFAQLLIPKDEDALCLLRHLYEHWDEQRPSFQKKDSPKERTGEKFVKRFPEGKPWSVTYTADDWLLGGVVPIAALTRELDALEIKALDFERERKGRRSSRSRG